MEAIYNFRLSINDKTCTITMDAEKIEDIEVSKQMKLLKTFTELNKKVKNIMELADNTNQEDKKESDETGAEKQNTVS